MPESPVSVTPPGSPLSFEAPRRSDAARGGAGHGLTVPAGPVRPVWMFINLADTYGGHEVMTLRWIESLREQGEVEPLLVCAEGSRLSELGPLKVRTVTVRIAEGSAWRKAVRIGQIFQVIRRLVRQERPALAVVAEGCLMAQRHGLFVTRALGLPTVLYVPLVSSFADMGVFDAERLDRKVLRYYRKLPTAWLTITAQQADELRRWTGISQPVFCLPNTVAGRVGVARDTAPAPDTPSRVLVLGRLDPHQKGLDRLLAHLRARPLMSGKVSVHLVGEGPYLGELEAALRDDPLLGKRLTLEGWQDGAAAITRHDVLLIASRFEGVPLVMLEAMAAGVPVVSSDLPGTRPYLPESCLYPFGEFDRAFEVVRALRTDPALHAEVVARNQQTYALLASPAAFDEGVRRLTVELGAVAAAR
jgi:glycosyltransferase involved in cell wall biosynthesis